MAPIFPLLTLSILTLLSLTVGQLRPTDTGRTCPAGEFDNGNFCQRCPSGTFQPNAGNFRCLPCPSGSAPSYNWQRCVSCKRGEFVSETRGCDRCHQNDYTDRPNAPACLPCPLGTENSFLRARSLASCRPCKPGHFQDLRYGRGNCDVCPHGSYQPAERATRCLACPAGTTSNVNREAGGPAKSIDRCFACAPGKFSVAVFNETAVPPVILRRFCGLCPEGSYSTTNRAKACAKCPPGSVPDETSSRCVPACKPGEKCHSCPAGMQPKRAGFMPRRKVKCVACPKGTVNTGKSVSACAECPSDLVANADGTACVCPKKLVRSPIAKPYEGEKACYRCPKGSKKADDNTCRCEDDAFQWSKREHQIGPFEFTIGECRCKPLTILKDGSCTPCPQKLLDKVLAGNSNPLICNHCPTGQMFNAKRATCEPCPEGTTVKPGFEKCVACTEETRGQPGCACAPGEELLYGKCKKCFWGKAVNGTYLNGCEYCAPGTFSDEFGLQECKVCPPKQRYAVSRGWRRCPPVCRPNTEVRDGECKCMAGYRMVGGQFRNPICEKCPGELMAYDGSRSCGCPTGHVIVNNKCVQCAAGTEVQDGLCAPCRRNFIAPVAGTEKCERCGEGSFFNSIGGTKCITCAKGEFVTPTGGCKSCKPGFRVRNGKCVKCVDSVSDGGNVSWCKPCKNGKVPAADGGSCV